MAVHRRWSQSWPWLWPRLRSSLPYNFQGCSLLWEADNVQRQWHPLRYKWWVKVELVDLPLVFWCLLTVPLLTAMALKGARGTQGGPASGRPVTLGSPSHSYATWKYYPKVRAKKVMSFSILFWIYIYIYIHIHINIYIYTHTYTYKYIHIYICIHIDIHMQRSCFIRKNVREYVDGSSEANESWQYWCGKSNASAWSLI